MSTKLYKNNQLQDIAGNFVLDNALDAASDNGVKNKVIAQAIGTLSNLTTTEKSNVVGAVNEINSDLTAYYNPTDGKWYRRNADGTKGSEIQVGKQLFPDYNNKIKTNITTTSYTATQDCFLVGMYSFGTGGRCVIVNDVPVQGNNTKLEIFLQKNDVVTFPIAPNTRNDGGGVAGVHVVGVKRI